MKHGQRLALITVFSIGTLTGHGAEAVSVSVTSGGNTIEVESFTTAGTVEDFYAFGNPDNASANTPIGLEDGNSDAAVFFLVEGSDTAPGTVSLGFIIDTPQDGSGGSASIAVSGFTSPPVIEVSDDGPETVFDAVSNTLNGNFTWFGCCTDGFLVSGIDTDILRLSFEITNVTGLANGFFFASPNGSGGADLFGISSEGTLAVPLPPAFALLFAGIAGLTLMARRASA